MPEPKTPQPSSEDFSKSLEDLKKQSQTIKSRIEDEKRKHDMPLDSNLGDPDWEDKAADGHLDAPEDEDE